MDEQQIEKTLKASFVSSANHLTQLYTNSLQISKQAYGQGHQKSTRDTIEWIAKNCGNKSTINTEEILEYLRSKLEDNASAKRTTSDPMAPSYGQTTPNQFDMYSDGSSFTFTFGAPSQHMHQNMQHHPSQPTPVASNSGFNFSPSVNTPYFPQMQQQQQQPQQTNPFFNPSQTDPKKRNFESPASSMEFSFPDQLNKKTKVNI